MKGKDVKLALKQTGLTMKVIAERLGMTTQGLNFNLRQNEVGGKFLKKVENEFNLSFSTKLSTVTEPNVAYKANARVIDPANVMYVPLVNQYAYAGYLSGYGDPEYVDGLPLIAFTSDKEYKGHYMSFEVRGDSMDDGTRRGLEAGDIVLGREVGRQHWQSKLHIDKYNFVIVHRTEGILIKKIRQHDVANGVLTLGSLNPMYDDFTVRLDEVAQLFNVVKVLINM